VEWALRGENAKGITPVADCDEKISLTSSLPTWEGSDSFWAEASIMFGRPWIPVWK